MKKIAFLIAIMLCATCSSALAAGAALASDAVTSTDGLQIYGGVDATDAARTDGVLLGKMSKGVNFRANYDNQGFAAATKHVSGTKAYGTAFNSTAIRFADIGTADIPSLSAADNGAFGNTWTNM